mgnify:CR=1 FL=1
MQVLDEKKQLSRTKLSVTVYGAVEGEKATQNAQVASSQVVIELTAFRRLSAGNCEADSGQGELSSRRGGTHPGRVAALLQRASSCWHPGLPCSVANSIC